MAVNTSPTWLQSASSSTTDLFPFARKAWDNNVFERSTLTLLRRTLFFTGLYGLVLLFLEAKNLTNQPLRYYQGSKEKTMQLEYYQISCK